MITTTTHSLRELQQNVESVIRGKSEAVRMAIVTLLAGGHLLVEDVPGVGKTTLAHTIARCLDCSFQRIQFTSDLLPSDIVGVSIFNPKTNDFEFKRAHFSQPALALAQVVTFFALEAVEERLVVTAERYVG